VPPIYVKLPLWRIDLFVGIAVVPIGMALDSIVLKYSLFYYSANIKEIIEF
jgi:hypothetical protein